MPVTDPIDWVGVEDAMFAWIKNATTIPATRIRVLQDRDVGEPVGPEPKALIYLLSSATIGTPAREIVPRIQSMTLTVSAGAGEVGIDFYPADSTTAQRISVAAGGGDLPADTAAALLAELTAELPAGYSVAADPDDTAAVILSGSTAQPVFAAAAAEASLLDVAIRIPRFLIMHTRRNRFVYRIEFTSPNVSGATTAANAMEQAKLWRGRLLDPAMRRLGCSPEGIPASLPSVPSDRSQSRAVLDLAFRVELTGAEAQYPMRVVGSTLTAT